MKSHDLPPFKGAGRYTGRPGILTFTEQPVKGLSIKVRGPGDPWIFFPLFQPLIRSVKKSAFTACNADKHQSLQVYHNCVLSKFDHACQQLPQEMGAINSINFVYLHISFVLECLA